MQRRRGERQGSGVGALKQLGYDSAKLLKLQDYYATSRIQNPADVVIMDHCIIHQVLPTLPVRASGSCSVLSTIAISALPKQNKLSHMVGICHSTYLNGPLLVGTSLSVSLVNSYSFIKPQIRYDILEKFRIPFSVWPK